MVIRALLVFTITLWPCAVSAQSTADGVRAIVRGDYTSAVAILRPLAENRDHGDPVAQFFLGTLYQSGHGVTRAQFRACALFRASAIPANPFRHQALQLAAEILGPLGARGDQFCRADALDLRDKSPSASFTLGPEHTVNFDEGGITIRDHAAENRIVIEMLPGFVPLPPRYIALDVTKPAPMRRHFIQQFYWSPPPDAGSHTWTLAWGVVEILGTDYIPVTGEPDVLTATGAEPPSSFNPDDLVKLRVGASGEAEWVILSGPKVGTGILPLKVR